MRSGSIALVAALLCSACRAQISDGLAAGGADGGAGSDVITECKSRSVYLSFEGEKLIRGRSDATVNQAEWMTIDEGAAPPYLAGSTEREARIKEIVEGVSRQLAGFPITVVTTRPTSGKYVMIVYGGTAAAVGSRFGGAVNRLDCDDSRPNDVAWVSDLVTPTQRAVNSTIGAIGFGLGLTATSDPADCMCGWDNDCDDDDTRPCNLGSPIERDPLARQVCFGAARMQDEVAALRTAFCQ